MHSYIRGMLLISFPGMHPYITDKELPSPLSMQWLMKLNNNKDQLGEIKRVFRSLLRSSTTRHAHLSLSKILHLFFSGSQKGLRH